MLIHILDSQLVNVLFGWPPPDVATMNDYIIELIIANLLNNLQVPKNEYKP
jgi:hypothetical protein